MKKAIGLAAAGCAIIGLAGCGAAGATHTTTTLPKAAVPTTVAAPASTPCVWPTTGVDGGAICSATAPTAVPTPVAVNLQACTAANLAKKGEWSQAETHWLSAEQHASGDYNATMALYLLVTDSGAVAMDKLTGAPTAIDITTYNTDLAAASDSVAGC